MPKYSLTISADTLDELFAHLPNTAVLAATDPVEPLKRGPGRPRKAAVETPAPVVTYTEAEPVEAPAPVVPVKAPAAKAPAAKPAVELTKPMVQQKLIEVVTKISKEACSSLCQAHGGANLSVLDPSVYPALYADACDLLDKSVA